MGILTPLDDSLDMIALGKVILIDKENKPNEQWGWRRGLGRGFGVGILEVGGYMMCLVENI